jgi:hypothetical protein
VVLLVVGVVALVGAARHLVDAIGDTYDTPASVSRTLDGGTTYLVYELTTGTTTNPGSTSVTESDVTVHGPDGAEVPVNAPDTGFTQTFQNGSDLWVGVAQFDAATTGTYLVDVGGSGSTVAVAPGFGALGRILGWIALIAIGGLLALAGLITLIVGLVRRSSSRKPKVTYAVPPAAAAYGSGYAAPAPSPGPGPAPVAPPPAVAPPPPAVAPPPPA